MLLGIAIGILAYFVSTFFYLLFVFSLIVGGVTMYFYSKLLLFSKVRHSIIAASIGVVTGILVALAYYGSSYMVIRNEFINNKKGDILLIVQQTYRDKKEKIKRNMLGQWEVPEPEYGSFVNAVNHRLAE